MYVDKKTFGILLQYWLQWIPLFPFQIIVENSSYVLTIQKSDIFIKGFVRWKALKHTIITLLFQTHHRQRKMVGALIKGTRLITETRRIRPWRDGLKLSRRVIWEDIRYKKRLSGACDRAAAELGVHDWVQNVLFDEQKT